MNVRVAVPAAALAAVLMLPLPASAKTINLACSTPGQAGTLYLRVDTDRNAADLSTSVAPGQWQPLMNVSVQEHVITAALSAPIKGQMVEFDYSIDRTTGVMTVTAPAYPQVKKQGSCTVA